MPYATPPAWELAIIIEIVGILAIAFSGEGCAQAELRECYAAVGVYQDAVGKCVSTMKKCNSVMDECSAERTHFERIENVDAARIGALEADNTRLNKMCRRGKK